MKASKVSIFIVICSLSFHLQAQTSFVKGYYVTTRGDSVRGYLSYLSDSKNIKGCVYKKDLSSEAIRLFPKDIVGYAFEDKVFYERMEFKGRPSDEALQGFVRVVVRGRLTLLAYENRYFVREESGAVSEITKARATNSNKTVSDYYGLGILKTLMSSDCPSMRDLLDVEYRGTPNFERIFRQYYKCAGISVAPSAKVKIKPRVDVGIQASFGLSHYKITM